LTVRVIFGTSSGGRIEYKEPGGSFVLPVDWNETNIGVSNNGSANIGFAPVLQTVFIDDIIVRRGEVDVVPTPEHTPEPGDIAGLSHHFKTPGGNTGSWMVIPNSNIKRVSTDEHPGLVTIWENGQGQDIKGILADPTALNDYLLPWEFHMGMIHNTRARMADTPNQVNYAFGLNIALTYSDPSSWPTDRTQQPPNTHSLQLLVVRLGGHGRNNQ
jgi:hypothetical protein